MIERLLCLGRIRTALHDEDSNIQHLGRSHRVVPERPFKALMHRDNGQCSHPGCASSARLQAHHVVHWLWGGRNDLRNMVLLCEAHHAAHHDGAFTIGPHGGAGFRFRRRDGRDLSAPPDREALAATSGDVETVHAATAPDAATPLWDGTRMDRDSISCLAEARSRERGGEDGREPSTLAG